MNMEIVYQFITSFVILLILAYAIQKGTYKTNKHE